MACPNYIKPKYCGTYPLLHVTKNISNFAILRHGQLHAYTKTIILAYLTKNLPRIKISIYSNKTLQKVITCISNWLQKVVIELIICVPPLTLLNFYVQSQFYFFILFSISQILQIVFSIHRKLVFTPAIFKKIIQVNIILEILFFGHFVVTFNIILLYFNSPFQGFEHTLDMHSRQQAVALTSSALRHWAEE